jgi:hypothetical protein
MTSYVLNQESFNPDNPTFQLNPDQEDAQNFLYIFFWRAIVCCVGHSFSYVAHFLFLRDVWIRTRIAAVASRCHPSPYTLYLIARNLGRVKLVHSEKST